MIKILTNNDIKGVTGAGYCLCYRIPNIGEFNPYTGECLGRCCNPEVRALRWEAFRGNTMIAQGACPTSYEGNATTPVLQYFKAPVKASEAPSVGVAESGLSI